MSSRFSPTRVLSVLALVATMVLIPIAPLEAASPIRVTAAGDLIITGTNSSDFISIGRGDGTAFSFFVSISSSSGASEGPVHGVTRNITINSRGGNDTVSVFRDIEVEKNLTVRLGSGANDFQWISGPTESEVGGNLTVIDGSGSSKVALSRVKVNGTTKLSMSGGANIVRTENSNFVGKATILTASNGRLQARSEFDRFNRGFRLAGSNQPDDLQIEGSVLIGTSSIDLRSGNDELSVRSATISGKASVRLGSGNDDVSLHGSDVRQTFDLRADGGNDVVEITAMNFAKRVKMNGGSGTDRLTGEANTFSVSPVVTAFEID